MQTKPPRWTPYVRHPDYWWYPPKERCQRCGVECKEYDPWEDGWQQQDDGGFRCCVCAGLPKVDYTAFPLLEVKRPKAAPNPEPSLLSRLWAGLVVLWNER